MMPSSLGFGRIEVTSCVCSCVLISLVQGMFWRWLVAEDPDVERFLIRDVDSRLNEREARAVDEWILSGKAYHIMRGQLVLCLLMVLCISLARTRRSSEPQLAHERRHVGRHEADRVQFSTDSCARSEERLC